MRKNTGYEDIFVTKILGNVIRLTNGRTNEVFNCQPYTPHLQEDGLRL